MVNQSLPIENKIFVVRGQRVMFDMDLAALYGVRTSALVQAVKRNLDRFPTDFMFQLDASEWESLRSQNVISKLGRGGRRYHPYAFTEHGVAMLSSVLKSPQAIAVNIEIVRTFVRMREIVASNKELGRRLDELETRTALIAGQQDSFSHATREHLKEVFAALRALMATGRPARKRPIGFVVTDAPSNEAADPS